jgi:hypothetical protein
MGENDGHGNKETKKDFIPAKGFTSSGEKGRDGGHPGLPLRAFDAVKETIGSSYHNRGLLWALGGGRCDNPPRCAQRSLPRVIPAPSPLRAPQLAATIVLGIIGAIEPRGWAWGPPVVQL